MAYSYTRQSSMSDGDTITSALFNNEYNQLVNAFAYSSSAAGSTGHRHDGTAGHGGNIHTIGDLDFLNKIAVSGNTWGVFVEVSSAAVEQIRIQDGAVVPVTDNDIDLGTSSLEFKDAYFDGTLYADAINFNGTAITSTAAELNILDGVTSTAAELNILDGVTSTAAELNTLDGVTAVVGELNALDIGVTAIGTAVASKAIILDANKDYTGVRNLTISGELDAATLDISGDADIDGTLEADAITIAGVTLSETIADTVGAMVTSNTESGVTVVYQDLDNTIDFTVGTLNQDTTGTAALATSVTVSANNSTAETVYPIFVDGATGTQGAESDTGLTYNPSTGMLTTTGVTSTFTGNITGNVTGNTSGTAATVTTAAQSNITSLGTLTALTVDNLGVNGNTITANSGALNLTPAVGSAIVLDGTINVDAGVVTGATSVTSTAFVGGLTGNVTGNTSGTALTVTQAAQTAITSVGTLTALAVDNITINGNDISSTAGTDLTITPLSGQQIVLDGTIIVDAGVVTGATSVTSTAFVGDITGNVTGNTSGTAATVTTAAQTNITSLGTLTALTVDDVAIDGKIITMTGSASDTAVLTAGTNGTLSIVTTDAAAAAANIQITADGTVDIDSAGVLTLDSGAAINIEPATGSAILLDGTISIDAGVVTGATSITSTAFAGALTGNVTGNASGTAATVTSGTQASITAAANLVTVGTIGTGVWQGTAIASGYIADDAITLAKMASGTDGNIISYDASGDPVAIATGTDGQVLTSTGAGSPPAFEDAASSGISTGKAIAMALVFG